MSIAAYKNQKISIKIKGCRAAAVFGVPKSSLLNQLKGINPRSETRANSDKLTGFEEEVPGNELLEPDKQGFLI